MQASERQQLHDEIIAGTVDIDGLSLQQLKGFMADFDITNQDYRPTGEFIDKVEAEIKRRTEVDRKCKKITNDFFGVEQCRQAVINRAKKTKNFF